MMTFLWVKHASGAVASAFLQTGMNLVTLFFFTYTRSRAVTSAISRHEAVTVTVPKPDQTGMLPLGKLWLVHKHICELH